MNDEGRGLYLVLLSLHGLVRGRDMELGRDPDTGGQVKYVVELARALAQDERVERVDLMTRLIVDPKVDGSYAEPVEDLGDGARIVRLPFGPRRYLRKETLWPHLDSFVDEALLYFRREGMVPHLVHGHYADAGYAGLRLASVLRVPLVQTGHSLGRVKEKRLLDRGLKPETIESRYHIRQRIEAEEVALDNASLLVASTQQEVDEQYGLYDNYRPERMAVVPPGVDLERFHPPRAAFRALPPVARRIDRFLREPWKPPVLALSRADSRKNLATLVRAFGENETLRERANLVIVAGNRDDIRTMDREPREVLTELLLLIDRYDLWGHVAIPKTHEADEVPQIYRLAARRRGVFVNPALTEPFGLTLLEAAASGLPVVATDDGGPREILARCENGAVVDALDAKTMAATIERAITDRALWRKRSLAGQRGVREHYSWQAHAAAYLRRIAPLVRATRSRRSEKDMRSKLPTADRILITDIDNTLLGEREGTRTLLARLAEHKGRVALGVATGRHLASAVEILKKWSVPSPEVLISSVGAEIHYGPGHEPDRGWEEYIDYRWDRERVLEVLTDVPGVTLQEKDAQRRHKVSYFYDPELCPNEAEIRTLLRRANAPANVIMSHGMYLDLLPVRCSKGRAVRYVANRWGIPADRMLVAGDSGNDEEMLTGDTLAVVVGNYSPELEELRDRERIYFSSKRCAWGILDGLERYRFFDREGPGAVNEDSKEKHEDTERGRREASA